ncbi:hypothetical protein OPV22_013062 [Ensete ventricosum]|uniref:Uncharacterized protein n=1 Tax=Ensete ventricosum TaxID=4639 RepID=A0AAV8R8V6_ENSVE|nr:hypothetical protein OPV22_013062 [Ensete ventricosum]
MENPEEVDQLLRNTRSRGKLEVLFGTRKKQVEAEMSKIDVNSVRQPVSGPVKPRLSQVGKASQFAQTCEKPFDMHVGGDHGICSKLIVRLHNSRQSPGHSASGCSYVQ